MLYIILEELFLHIFSFINRILLAIFLARIWDDPRREFYSFKTKKELRKDGIKRHSKLLMGIILCSVFYASIWLYRPILSFLIPDNYETVEGRMNIQYFEDYAVFTDSERYWSHIHNDYIVIFSVDEETQDEPMVFTCEHIHSYKKMLASQDKTVLVKYNNLDGETTIYSIEVID